MEGVFNFLGSLQMKPLSITLQVAALEWWFQSKLFVRESFAK